MSLLGSLGSPTLASEKTQGTSLELAQKSVKEAIADIKKVLEPASEEETYVETTANNVESANLPTRVFNVLNVKEPTVDKNASKFVYNKFEIDEALEISSITTLDGIETSNNLNAFLEEKKTKALSRFNLLSFVSNNSTDIVGEGEPTPGDLSLISKVENSLSDGSLRLDSIVVEGGMTNFYSSGFELFDTYADTRLYSILNLHQNLTSEETNKYDGVKEYMNRANTTSNGVLNNDIINNFLSDLSKQDIPVLSSTDPVNKFKYQSVSVNINSLFLNDVIKASEDDTCHIFEDEIRAISSLSKELQDNAVSIIDPNNFSDSEFSTFLRSGILHDSYIISEADITKGPFQTYFKKHIGYVVEKIEFFGTEVRNFEPFLIRSTKTVSFSDKKVRYGARYVYRIRNLYSIVYTFYNKIPEDPTLDQFYRGVFVVASKSDDAEVDCREFVRPLPPVDLKFQYARRLQSLKIKWNFPINPTKDIKGFQLFRRAATNRGFTLIAEFDFNNSLVKPLLREVAPSRDFYRYQSSKIDDRPLVVKRFFDQGFTEDKEYIYALASVDAHGLTSDLSVQVGIKYNTVTEVLEHRIISRPFAPKAYPNIFLKKDLFLDTIKTSGKDRLTVYFEPEYFEINKTKNISAGVGQILPQNLISIHDDAEENLDKFNYLINFLNTDLQKSNNLKIKIINNSFAENVLLDPLIDEDNLSLAFIDKSSP